MSSVKLVFISSNIQVRLNAKQWILKSLPEEAEAGAGGSDTPLTPPGLLEAVATTSITANVMHLTKQAEQKQLNKPKQYVDTDNYSRIIRGEGLVLALVF